MSTATSYSLDSEAQRVRSDLDNVFADFDKVARGTLRLKTPKEPEVAPTFSSQYSSYPYDASSFDEIMTLTQNLDEELSAWDSIVIDDAPPLMFNSYVPQSSSTMTPASNASKPQGADSVSSRAFPSPFAVPTAYFSFLTNFHNQSG